MVDIDACDAGRIPVLVAEAVVSILVVAGGDDVEFLWGWWALLRDCVEHHLGPVTERRFPVLGALGNVVFEGRLQFPPDKLARELQEVSVRFTSLGMSALVISPATLGVLFARSAPAETCRPLTEQELAHFPSASGSGSLAEYFAPLLGSLLRVCQAAERAGSWVEVIHH